MHSPLQHQEFAVENKEYKVLTSNTPAFSSREKMQRILEEEAQAGWRLVEKYDNFKIRVERDVSARENDANCPFDPYRTTVGVNSAVYMGIAAVVTVLVIILVIQLAALTIA